MKTKSFHDFQNFQKLSHNNLQNIQGSFGMKVGYARVSTTDQNLDGQVIKLKEVGCDKLFEEKQSGKSAKDRPKLQECISYVREGDVLVVTKLDRLARSVFDLHAVANKLQEKGVDLVILNMNLDTSTPAGKLLFTMLGAIAEFERDLINERTTEGRLNAMSNGVKFGRKIKVDDKMKTAIKARMEYLKSIGAPASKDQIAEEFGVGRASVYRALNSN